MDIIVDIDGTVADCNHRLCYIQGGNKDWKKFYAYMHLDEPIEPTIQLVKELMYGGNNILWCTGRPIDHLVTTEKWLDDHNLPYRNLYMRPKNDYRPDYIVKQELLLEMRKDGFNPVAAFEDRTRVAEMWRNNGLICYQVANNEGYA